MKKIVTAIGNPILNQKLKLQNNLEIIGNDIQYQEGIFEILEKQKNIDFLILSEIICEEISINNLIEKIKLINSNIKIIVILENKKPELENILITKGVYKIIYNNQMQIKDMISIINNIKQNNENEQLKYEIDNLKSLIIQNNSTNQEKTKKLDLFSLKKSREIKKQIISISGPSGVGKSIISVNLAKALAWKKQKILLIDFDILNHSLHTILGVSKYSKKIKQINNLDINQYIIKINKRTDLIAATDILFGTKEKIDYIKIEKVINELRQIYDTIIIDTSSECFFDFTKTIIKLSDKNIFVTETNILEIKKAKELLRIYINEWKINKNKFNILFNKYDKNCISMNLLKELFFEFNIIGFLKYNSKYNKLINRNIKNYFYDKGIRNEYLKINEKI